MPVNVIHRTAITPHGRLFKSTACQRQTQVVHEMSTYKSAKGKRTWLEVICKDESRTDGDRVRDIASDDGDGKNGIDSLSPGEGKEAHEH